MALCEIATALKLGRSKSSALNSRKILADRRVTWLPVV